MRLACRAPGHRGHALQTSLGICFLHQLAGVASTSPLLVYLVQHFHFFIDCRSQVAVCSYYNSTHLGSTIAVA